MTQTCIILWTEPPYGNPASARTAMAPAAGPPSTLGGGVLSMAAAEGIEAARARQGWGWVSHKGAGGMKVVVGQ